MNNVLQVNIAEMIVSQAPIILSCIGLGSCVGVALYESQKKIGGLAHVMLPECNDMMKNKNLAKFANTAINFMLQKMIEKGADCQIIKAKIFGGANMFPTIAPGALNKIGKRNIDMIRVELQRHAIPLLAKDVGGSKGRSITFDLTTGIVYVKMLNVGGEKKF